MSGSRPKLALQTVQFSEEAAHPHIGIDTLLKSAALLPLVPASKPLLTTAPTARKRSVRFAYIGDTHITPDTKPMESIAKCFHHAQNQADKPSFVLHGGDVIMDALKQDRAGVQKQWDAWHTVMKADNSLPIEEPAFRPLTLRPR